jgi:UDP-N-acetylmuramoylalanine--D-glutamate ligase
MLLPELAGRSVVVWGLGREGRAALEALGDVAVRSLAVVDDDELTYSSRSGDSFTSQVGDAGLAAMRAADVVLKSPGISKYDERALDLADRGVVVTSGTAMWMAAHHAATVGVTGSKGKSTTASLISHLLAALGVANQFGGNIGTPLLSLPAADQYVVELSSYQCADLQHSPRVAAITSLFAEHLNWHGSEERYFTDKLNILAHRPQAVVYSAHERRLAAIVPSLVESALAIVVRKPDSFDIVPGPDGPEFAFAGVRLFGRDASPLLGEHNASNVCIALGVLAALGVECVARRAEIEAALRSFAPLPHRLATVPDPSGLMFVDDSLSTAPEATIAALQAFPAGPMCLILGGQDRGISYAALRDCLIAQQRELVAIGIPESGPRIVAALADLPHVACHIAQDLDDAVALARRETPVPGTVLLSPAAPSYGRYANFEDRAAAFVRAVKKTSRRPHRPR